MNPLSKKEIQNKLENLHNWSFESDKLKKEFQFSDFKEALSFIVRVGFEAESQGHHPELFNVYNTVKIELSTHDADNKVTQKDVKLAETVEKIYKSF